MDATILISAAITSYTAPLQDEACWWSLMKGLSWVLATPLGLPIPSFLISYFASDAHSFKRFQSIQEVEGWQQGSPSLQLLRDFHQCWGVVTIVWWVVHVSVSKPNNPTGVDWKHLLVCPWCSIWGKELLVHISQAKFLQYSLCSSSFLLSLGVNLSAFFPFLPSIFTDIGLGLVLKIICLFYAIYSYSHSGFYGMSGELDKSLAFCRNRWEFKKSNYPDSSHSKHKIKSTQQQYVQRDRLWDSKMIFWCSYYTEVKMFVSGNGEDWRLSQEFDAQWVSQCSTMGRLNPLFAMGGYKGIGTF